MTIPSSCATCATDSSDDQPDGATRTTELSRAAVPQVLLVEDDAAIRSR